MRFQCKVSELMSGLSIVNRALATRSTLQILEGVLVETCPEGLRLTCSDLALGIETLVEAEVAEEGRAVMPGRLFSEIVRKLPDGTMEVSVNENHSATIRCQSARSPRSSAAWTASVGHCETGASGVMARLRNASGTGYTSASSISAASCLHTDRTSPQSVQRATRFRYAPSCPVTDESFGRGSASWRASCAATPRPPPCWSA